MTSFADKLHALGTVFDLVGETEYVDAIAKVTMAYEASGYKDTPEVRDCEREVDLACTHTASLLGQTKAATTLLDVVSPYWRDLVVLWGHKATRLHVIWDPVIAVLANTFSVTTAMAEFVVVQDDPAAPEFVAVLHGLSEKDSNLRLMFMEADDPDTVYVATVTNEPALDAMLLPYESSNWRGDEVISEEDETVVTWFRMYRLGDSRVFRTDGYVCSTDRGALEVLKTGIMLPRVAKTTTSVLRVSFSLQAMADPHFRDFLRSLGGVPVSKTTWDLPVYESADVQRLLRDVKKGFEYPVEIYEVVDTPERSIRMFTTPDTHIAQILSGHRTVISGTVDRPSLSDVYEHAVAALPLVEGSARHALEHVAGACRLRAHMLVVRAGELMEASVPQMFSARVDAEPVRVVLVVGGRYPTLVTEDSL